MMNEIKTEITPASSGNRHQGRGADRFDFMPLTRELCAFKTSVVADDNEPMFRRLLKELPFKLLRFASGETHNGWRVQPNWRVKKALIRRNGAVVFDGTDHALGVAMNALSFTGEVSLEELKSHVMTNPNLLDGFMFHSIWQIRNWEPDWAFCMPYRTYQTLEPGNYEVELVTETEPGEMIVAEYEKRGRSDEVILFNTNTCHPTMANDGFASVAMLVRLFQWLAEQDTYYTYRLILAPEYMGSIFYMRDKSPDEIERIKACVFAEMPGTPDPLKIASSYLGNQDIDRIFHNAARHGSEGYELAAWRHGAGNDEVVWESPGYEIPTVEITRAQSNEAPYPEYHSSLDNPDLMDTGMMEEFYEVLRSVIGIAENNAVLHRHFDGLICLSHPDYQMYFERPDPAIEKGLTEEDNKWGRLLHSLFRYFDGSMSILDIAERHDLPFEKLLRYLKQFEEKGLISLEFRPLDRPVLTRKQPT